MQLKTVTLSWSTKYYTKNPFDRPKERYTIFYFSILLLYWSYINAGVFLGYPYDFFIIRRKDMFEKRERGLKHIYVIFKYFWSKYADLFLIKLMGKYINYFYDLLYLIMKKNAKTLNGQIFLKFWKFHLFLIFIFLL